MGSHEKRSSNMPKLCTSAGAYEDQSPADQERVQQSILSGLDKLYRDSLDLPPMQGEESGRCAGSLNKRVQARNARRMEDDATSSTKG